jgi:hypothetical protein
LHYFAVKIITLVTHDKKAIRHLLNVHFSAPVITLFFIDSSGNKNYHARTGIFQADTNWLSLQTLYDIQIQIDDCQSIGTVGNLKKRQPDYHFWEIFKKIKNR